MRLRSATQTDRCMSDTVSNHCIGLQGHGQVACRKIATPVAIRVQVVISVYNCAKLYHDRSILRKNKSRKRT